MRRPRPSGTATTAAPTGQGTAADIQTPSGRARAGRAPYLRAWTASASGPPKSPAARQLTKGGGAARQAPQTGAGPGRPQRPQPDGTGSTASRQVRQNGPSAEESRPSRQAAQRGGERRSSSAA